MLFRSLTSEKAFVKWGYGKLFTKADLRKMIANVKSDAQVLVKSVSYDRGDSAQLKGWQNDIYAHHYAKLAGRHAEESAQKVSEVFRYDYVGVTSEALELEHDFYAHFLMRDLAELVLEGGQVVQFDRAFSPVNPTKRLKFSADLA